MSFRFFRRALWVAIVSVASAAAALVPDAAAVASEVAAAQALQEAHKFAEARAAFEQILAHAPDNAPANGALAIIACNEGKWERALELAEKAVTAEPQSANYQYVWGAANGLAALKGGVFSKLGYAKKCLAAYRRASELEPKAQQYHWALLNYYQQAPGFAGGDIELAYAQAAEIKMLNGDSGRQAYAQLYLGQKKYELAFKEYEEALREKPDDLGARYNFGRVALAAGQRLDEGLAAFRKCLELPMPEGREAPMRADLHWRIGSVWEQKKDIEAARAEYLAALKEQPEFRPAQRALEKLAAAKD